MADEVNTDAFEGGDTEATTKAAIEARNGVLQTQSDANLAAADDLATARQTYIDALADAESTAFEDDPGLKTGAPVEG